MFVRVQRPQGFMVGNKHIVVRPDKHPQFLPDEAREADGFSLLVKHGDLVVVDVAPPAAPEKPAKKEK